MERILIVNADDFGLSAGVNCGIQRAHRDGILTSASLMVRRTAAQKAAEAADGMDLGLHIDLEEWVYQDGQWKNRYQRVPIDDAAAVNQEIQQQLTMFRQLTGNSPSHLDSHQHVHWQEPVRGVALRIAGELGVPLRGISNRVRYCGSFYGQSGKGAPYIEAISVESLISLLAALPPGVTEMACHPGADNELDSPYKDERVIEVATLCDPRVRHTVEQEGIRLMSFEELGLDSSAKSMPAAKPWV
jgi:predicted glycoside hydrolase/deacetylase ChbG (UPF0249 family)